jgi:hypothetical protein
VAARIVIIVLFSNTQHTAHAQVTRRMQCGRWLIAFRPQAARKVCSRRCCRLHFLDFSPNSRTRALSSGLIARDQIACVTQAALECREAQHDY